MTVSVLIAAYNAAKTIEDAVKSILKQTFTDFELIIINDASTDNTLQVLNSINDNRIKVITNEKNLGQIRSLNKGIDYCSGKYIARMDADDYSFPDRFALEVKELDNDPELAIVSTNGYMFFSNGKRKKMRYYPGNIDELRFLSLFRSPIVHVSVMIRAESVRDMKLYDENYLISADWELWSRLLKKGLKFRVIGNKSVSIFINENTYGRKNADVEFRENIPIVKNNVNFFTKKVITDAEANEILLLFAYESLNVKVVWKRFLIWFGVSKEFRYVSKLHFFKIFIKMILILIWGYGRRYTRTI